MDRRPLVRRASQRAVRPTILTIILPTVFVTVGAIVGLAIYLYMRRRRTPREGQQHLVDSGENAVAGSRVEMEGLNELGEAPPPYRVTGRRKEGPQVTVSGLDASEPSREVVPELPAEPPPAYIAAMAIREPRDGSGTDDSLVIGGGDDFTSLESGSLHVMTPAGRI